MQNETKTERIQLLMAPSEVKAIDDWAHSQRIRTRAEAIRRLCHIALRAEDLGYMVHVADDTPAPAWPAPEVLARRALEAEETVSIVLAAAANGIEITLSEADDAYQSAKRVAPESALAAALAGILARKPELKALRKKASGHIDQG